ncbi:MAG: hypothetical protein EOP32_03275 [Rhodococcus sp. (in: high G+C Gram-positive bacteria)]|nr:MAG: hypothetical protein EOP32_03275 [Rhodococcus sp. (in: high G+C Gram-positive bacteria)]
MTVCSSRFDNGVAILTIDNPPVNAGSHAVRSALLTELRRLRATPELRGVVITGVGANFYSGSDLKEFDGPLAEPQLPAVIAEIESLPVPVVAAIRGLALGGGFELALGCDIRIGTHTAVVGLPEVNLGIIPGAGGTVRLPRLVGAAQALDLIGTATRIPAEQAADLGTIDELVDEDVMGRALEAARTCTKRILRHEAVPPVDPAEFGEVADRIKQKGRNRPHILEAIAAVRRAVTNSADDALVAEREVFTRLRESDEAASLRYLFFAERAAAKSLGSATPPRPVDAVTVVGAGTMGASIAAASVLAGYRTTITDTDEAALSRARGVVETALTKAGRPELAEHMVTDRALPTAVHAADLVIDAVFEDLDIKRALFRDLDRHTSAGAILASNTSYLDLDDIGSVVADSSRVIGLHFFNPAHLNKLIEVVETAKTSPEAMATAAQVVRTLGKVGIRARVGEGFVANRIYAAYRAQCEFLIEDGCTPEQIDRALVEFGFAMGPFAVADMSGLDIAWARRKRLAATRNPRQRYVHIPDLLCEAGRLGRKTGAGWYAYEGDGHTAVPDPAVTALIEAERARKKIVPRSFDEETIVRRVIAAMVLEAMDVLEDGVATSASDIDLAMVKGFAFPRWHGGPLKFASHQTSTWLSTGIQEVHQSCPVTFSAEGPITPSGAITTTVREVLAGI